MTSANAILKATGTQRQATLLLIKQMKESGELVLDPVTRLYKPRDEVLVPAGSEWFREPVVMVLVEVVPDPLRGGTTQYQSR